MAGEFVTVCCKLTSGVLMSAEGFDPIEISGSNQGHHDSNDRSGVAVAGIGKTRVPADMWAAWSKASSGWPPLVDGSVYLAQMAGVKGGDVLAQRLAQIVQKLEKAESVRVGFLENATYPDGKPVAQIAAIQEYGATITVAEHETSIFRSIDKNGEFRNNGRFVKISKANIETRHAVPEHTITIPSRPFFRTTIAAKSPAWGDDLAKAIKEKKYDAKQALAAMGQVISEQIQTGIVKFDGVPLATSTIRKKGFDKQLIDTGAMMRAVDYEVK